MNKLIFAFFVGSILYPLAGNCVFISTEEMDAPIKGARIQQDIKVEDVSVGQAARMASVALQLLKGKVYTNIIDLDFGYTITEECKIELGKHQAEARRIIDNFVKTHPETPFPVLRTVKHVLNTYTEIEDYVAYLNGDNSIKLSKLTPADGAPSNTENVRFGIYPNKEIFKDRWHELTPTQNIWEWAKDRQIKARLPEDLPPLEPIHGKEEGKESKGEK